MRCLLVPFFVTNLTAISIILECQVDFALRAREKTITQFTNPIMSAATHCKGSGAANAFDKYNTEKSGLAAGLAKGHVVVKYSAKVKTRSRSLKKSDKTQAARSLAREVMGLAPYEKRILDVLKTGAGNVEKRMYKMGKKRLGTHRRALKKRDEIKQYWAKLRQAASN